MNAKDLIKMNNEKREELTKENEAYYSDILLYIRTHLTLSEQQSEELLMELLDHLLEGQKEGKRAEDIFGSDPKGYCDEMIAQIPKEDRKNNFTFILFLMIQFAGWIALTRGALELIIGFFTEINNTVFLGTAVVKSMINFLVLYGVVIGIFSWLKNSIYKKNSKIKDFFVVFLLMCTAVTVFVLFSKIIPNFGYAIEVGWLFYLISGIVLLLLTVLINKKARITK
ncbi:DUF1129 family protein [Mesobacillus zeae]|uniref:DUF1129 family protein n=1 Tax=Mesobacillus zeae TaxID=1917180 RepID=A0A398B8Q2_9BACI|nr:DUF1129 family protein [Mesobacillus zeae]RID85871.1 DUF1129 family protein [Mesobacillus zeae]